MKRLYLLRHAKSSWDDPSIPDRERPLNPRGRRAAKAMAGHFREQRIEPRVVLCSPAVRTRETLARIEPALGRPRVRIEAGLYGAGVGTLLALLLALPDTEDSILVIGHNPGLQDLVVYLARPAPARDDVEAKFPTAALATLTYTGRWSGLGAETADLVAYVRPRDLR